MGIPEGKDSSRGFNNLFDDIIAKTVSYLEKDKNTQIKEVYRRILFKLQMTIPRTQYGKILQSATQREFLIFKKNKTGYF